MVLIMAVLVNVRSIYLAPFIVIPGARELPSVKDRHYQGRMAGIGFHKDLDACVDGCAGDVYSSGIAGMGRLCVDDL